MANPWSISKLKAYEQCPRKYHEERVLKSVKRPDNAAADAGDATHKSFEQFLLRGTELPPQNKRHSNILTFIKSRLDGLETYPECKLAATELLTACDYDHDLCWVRGIADLVAIGNSIAVVFDWKTGRPNDDSDQLALMALLVMIHFPQITQVRTAYYWMKETRIAPYVFYRDKHWLPLWGQFYKRVDRMKSDTTFFPRSNFLCRSWCNVRTCPYNGANA